MSEINPPLRRLQIGSVRSIELYDAEESKRVTSQMRYLTEVPEVTGLFGGRPYRVIGRIDTGGAALYDPDEKIKGVFVESEYKNDSLTRVADSLENFYRIVLLIQKAWKGKETVRSLEQSKENFALREEVLSEIRRDNPESDAGYWNYVAFRELDIRLGRRPERG